MADPHPSPLPGAPERTAWTLVANALEQALDTPGLRARDRGILAELHDSAGTYLGVPACQPPPAPEPERRDLASMIAELQEINAKMRENNARFLESLGAQTGAAVDPADGIDQLYISVEIHGALRRAGLQRVADVDVYDRRGRTVLEIPGIGPKRAADLLAALEHYHREHAA